MARRLTLGLFATSPEGTECLGALDDPELVEAARERLAAARRRDLAALGAHLRPLEDADLGDGARS